MEIDEVEEVEVDAEPMEIDYDIVIHDEQELEIFIFFTW